MESNATSIATKAPLYRVTDVYAKSIAVVGNDVYVCDDSLTNFGQSFAVYWKNGIIHTLGTNGINSSASSMTTACRDVYIAGSVDYYSATNRKNGVASSLS